MDRWFLLKGVLLAGGGWSEPVNATLAIFGALGGLAVFGTAVWAVIRAITRQITATEQNTSATQSNTTAIRELENKVDTLDRTVFRHGEKLESQGTEITRLSNAINNGRPGR